MKVLQTRFCALLALPILMLGYSCTVHEEYDVNINEIDTEVSLFEDGLSLPLGSTNKVVLSSLLNSAGQSIDEFLKTDAQTGMLVLSYDGEISLADQLSKLDLSSISSVNGVSVSNGFTYKIGDLDVDTFKVPAQNFNVSVGFSGVQSVDLDIPPFAPNLDALNFKAGLDKYKNIVSGNADLNLGNKIGKLDFEKEVEKDASLASQIPVWAMAAGLGVNDPVPIPKSFLPDVTVSSTAVAVKVTGFELHDDVTAIRDITLDSNAKLKVSLKMSHPFITDGNIIPDVDLDLSGLLNIEGGSKIDLSSLALNPENNWTAEKTYNITGLKTTDYEGVIAIDENIIVDGTILINDPKTTASALATTDPMKLEIAIQFTDLTIVSAEIDVKSIEFKHNDVVTIGSNTPFNVPDEITDIKEVTMDPTKPITLKIIPSNLDCLKSKNLPYTIDIQFPETVDVAGAVDGKLTISGDMVDGPVNQDIFITAFHPVIDAGSVSLKADISIDAEFKAQNLVISTDDLPQTADKDLAFTVSLDGNPAISDITVTIADIVKETELGDQIEFEVNGLDSFGSFVITPEGNPALTIDCNIPDLPGLDIIPGADGIQMTLPDIFEFETTNLNPQVTFTAETNTLKITDAIPTNITLPIKCIKVHPVVVNDVAKVVTSYAVTGSILIPSADIKHSDIQVITGEEFGISVAIPELKVKTLDLDDAISFDVDSSYDFGFDLDTGGIVKQIAEVTLDDVYLNLKATFEGLPDMGEEQFDVDLMLSLPEFIVPNQIPVTGKVANNKIEIAPVKIEKLANVQINDKNRVEGQIGVSGTVSASGKNIDLTSLQSEISVQFDASIGDSNGKIPIGKVTGAFTYDFNQNANVKFNNLPDILTQDGVCLDLADPQITLTVTTNMGIVMGGNITIVPIQGGVDQEDRKIVIPTITLPYSTTASQTVSKSFVICKSAATAPAGYEVLEADVASLLTDIPEELRVEIRAGVDQKVLSILETNAEYSLDITYGITAPIAFGADFRFTTNTEFDMGNVSEFTKYGDFVIKGKAVNDSPINLSVDLVLLDAQGAEIPQSKPCKLVLQGAATSDLEIGLSPADKSRAISKARLDITVTAVPDMPLMNTSSLQLTDMVAVLPHGVTVDPADLTK